MCMMDDGDGDWTNLGQTERTARKAHPCYECPRVIQPGETYEDARGIGDGHVFVMRTCGHCLAARLWLQEVCRGWLWGAVHDDLYEHYDEGSTLVTADLLRVLVWRRRGWAASHRPGDRTLVPVEVVQAATRRATDAALARIASARAA